MQVFPDVFANKASFHALLHLDIMHAALEPFVISSVALKEAVHKIYKSVVPNTNKQNLQRDLTVFENEMQGLRFLADGYRDERYATEPGDGLIDFLRSGIVENLYISPVDEVDEDHFDSNDEILFGGTDVSMISLRGKPWTRSQILERGLPSSPLNNVQMGELAEAYKEYEDYTLNINRSISYYNGVSYFIRGADEEDGAGNWRDARPVNVVVNTGDILEVLEPDGKPAFVRVLAAMKHIRSVFLVVVWLVPTGYPHPQLDHPSFVNSSHFIDLGSGKYVRNEWIFRVVWLWEGMILIFNFISLNNILMPRVMDCHLG